MKVLVVGGGGREHALCKAIVDSPMCSKLFCAPGNAGIAEMAECWPIAVDDVTALVEAAQKNEIDFVIVGPELPLALGLVDDLTEAGIMVFGPSKLAAELETSKVFMKDLCDRAGIPTAQYKKFRDIDEAYDYIEQQIPPIVVKVDGLAGGKGVTIATSVSEAKAAVRAAMEDKVFGPAGEEVVIEDFLEGEEASVFALCDGKTARFFASAQDHKRAFDGDQGPNTGGMGAYSPAPSIDRAMQERIMEEIINPTIAEMNAMERPFVGVLFAGLMITKAGPRLLEYNARFGDPEAEVVLPLLKTDLLSLLYACTQETLAETKIEWEDGSALGVVMAVEGYPGNFLKGSVVRGLGKAEEVPYVTVYHSGTVKNATGEIAAVGGRVLCITATGPTVDEAKKTAYEAVDEIQWPEGFCRRDIGWRACACKQA